MSYVLLGTPRRLNSVAYSTPSPSYCSNRVPV